MSMTTINVRIDQQTKRDMAEVCDQLGLSMSAAFTVFAKTVARERRIPFELNADPFNSPANMARLRHSAAQLENGQASAHDLLDE
ncbi:type II toxin-antitoxin system RelB/DinJ family antitoxin [Bifidobacterium pullorum]|uniref:type II toxin-antitoxin system RelB/DinJ family antitoxin n=1 Tax=Bifidobacterium pullorum TaxID=78448 RepID=UPI00242D6C5B|nr:type II toxin-antitoxin system RelB/DinJ family antitoxin [Bifidobacterium pullorum]